MRQSIIASLSGGGDSKKSNSPVAPPLTAPATAPGAAPISLETLFRNASLQQQNINRSDNARPPQPFNRSENPRPQPFHRSETEAKKSHNRACWIPL